MNRKKIIALVLLFIIFIPCAFSASLSAEKNVSSPSHKTGDDVKISLIVGNPFNQDVSIRIVDKNIFANNGLDIQCLEYTIPANRAVELGYEPVKAYSAGNYSLGEAEITYINPESGREEKIFSKPINISVTGATTGAASGITTIYRCGGMNMQSTSFSSSGQQQQSQQQQQKPEDTQSKVQNNQLNQNTQALQEEIADQKKQEEEFNKNLESNPDFRKKDSGLKQQGYQPKESKQNPTANDSGSFEKKYEKPSGEQAVMRGEMEGGEMKNLSTEYRDSEEKMLEALQKNPQFQNISKELQERGFNQTTPGFTPLGDNKTKISIPFNDSFGNQKNISAEYRNGNITKVELGEEKKEEKKDLLPWMILFALIAVAAFLLYRRFMKKKAVKREFGVGKAVEEPVDYQSVAKNMLAEAEKLFACGREKDAYEKVSQAVRYYYAMKLEAGKELNATELLALLKNKGIDHSTAQKCLSLCGMVEFARYKPNKEDFDEIISSAQKIIY